MSRDIRNLRHLVRVPIVGNKWVFIRPTAVVSIEEAGVNTQVTLLTGGAVTVTMAMDNVAMEMDEYIRRDAAAS